MGMMNGFRTPPKGQHPGKAALLDLAAGDFVKVCRNRERFWVELTYVNRWTNVLRGVPANDLISNEDIQDCEIGFAKENVFAIQEAADIDHVTL